MSNTCAVQTHRRDSGRQSIARPASAVRRQRLNMLEIATLVVIALLLVVGAVTVRPHTPTIDSTKTVQVSAGETLWSIAAAHPISGLTTAQTAESIARDNGLSGAVLSTGQTLVVPAGVADESQMASR